MKLKEESTTLQVGVDDARELIECLPPYGSIEVRLEWLRNSNIPDKLKVLADFFLPIPDHHPDLPALVVDFGYGAKRVAPYIAQEVKERLPEIRAYLNVTERKLSRAVAALRRSPDNPSLKDKVKEVARLRLMLRTLKRIGEKEVEIEAVPLGHSDQNYESISHYLDAKFRHLSGTLSFPDRPVQAD